MDISNSRFDALVANTGTPRYRHVSEGFAKHLSFPHMFSTKMSPADQSGGMNPSGVAFCVDGIFSAKARNLALKAKNGNVDDYPASTEIIAMSEWPTQSRIRNIRFVASKATASANFNPGSFNTTYFDANTAAAFPAFTLQANDPNDSTFTPIPLLDLFTNGTDAVIPQLSLAALAYGFNRRKDPLIIECVLGGNVVANSFLAVFCEFIKPHT